MAVKYYAVRKGIKPGIYKDWNTCKAMVTGFSGAQYKSFTTLQEAEAYIKEDAETAQVGKEPEVYAFVDGSFNQKTHVYGYGGFLVHDGVKEVLQGSGKDADMASMRNVAGEVLGSMAAIEKPLNSDWKNCPFIMIIWESKCGQRDCGSAIKREQLPTTIMCSL